MNNLRKQGEAFAARWADHVLRWRWLVVAVSLLLTWGMMSGAQYLRSSNDYAAFFAKDNPDLLAFVELQATYAKNDNFFFLMVPEDGEVFTPETLRAVHTVTQEGWQVPHASRVDSVTNFQHTYADGDLLVVEDLVDLSEPLTPDRLARVREIAVNEPLLRNQLITPDARATAVLVTVQYPDDNPDALAESVAKARAIEAEVEARWPGVQIELTGLSMLDNTFAEEPPRSLGLMLLIMFGVVLVLSAMLLRSVFSIVAIFLVTICACIIGVGAAGFLRVAITPVSIVAPVVILTLAVADSIHILSSLRNRLLGGAEKRTAMVEAVSVNYVPVFVTSFTTMIGFLALNFSDAPPVKDFGNIAALGIGAAWLLSVTLLPAVMMILPMGRVREPSGVNMMAALGDFVVRRHRALFIGTGVLGLALIAAIPQIRFNDTFAEYFDNRVPYRQSLDITRNYFGVDRYEFSVPANGPGGVSDPEYLAHLDRFADYIRSLDKVTHVYAVTDILKRLNRNMHGDDPAYYRLPETDELSAQYLLLYELSLPYGLDLTDRINIDKSASRVSVSCHSLSSIESKAFIDKTRAWLQQNAPAYMETSATSPGVMFTYITQRNVESMVWGTGLAVVAIAAIMALALRSTRLGLLSLVPNTIPILMALGVWALTVREIGFSFSIIFSLSLGIIVDDTVHFLTAFLRGQRERGLAPPDAIRHAFSQVGYAIFINTIILVIGFAVLMTSSFKVTADMGLLTAMAIGFALLFDFFFLPGLLLLIYGRRKSGEMSRAERAELSKPKGGFLA